MSRSYRHHPIVKMHMSGGKEIANRQYRRRVNAGIFDDYPHHAKASYKRIGIDQYDVIDGVLRQPWSSVQAEIEMTRKAFERRGVMLAEPVPEKWWTYSRLRDTDDREPEFEQLPELEPIYRKGRLPERFASFDDWVQFRFQEWRRWYYWK